jgi:hypothetical protein
MTRLLPLFIPDNKKQVSETTASQVNMGAAI